MNINCKEEEREIVCSNFESTEPFRYVAKRKFRSTNEKWNKRKGDKLNRLGARETSKKRHRPLRFVRHSDIRAGDNWVNPRPKSARRRPTWRWNDGNRWLEAEIALERKIIIVIDRLYSFLFFDRISKNLSQSIVFSVSKIILIIFRSIYGLIQIFRNLKISNVTSVVLELFQFFYNAEM